MATTEGAVWAPGNVTTVVRRAIVLSACFSFAWALSTIAGEVTAGRPQPGERREHYVVQAPRTRRLYKMTIIYRGGEDSFSPVTLIEDDERNALIYTSEMRLSDLVNVNELRDVRRKTWVRITNPINIPAKTIEDVLAWFKTHAAQFPEPTMYTVETSSGATITGTPKEWQDSSTVEPWKQQLRQSMDPVFLEEIETLYDGLSGAYQLAQLTSVLPFLVHRASCDLVAGTKVTSDYPDCQFDSGFGFPCSDVQKEMVDKIVKSEPPPLSY